MMWYAIQTYTGREERLVEMLRLQLPKSSYGECFVAYFEQLRDRRQENQIHILRLFPGYIFISSDDIGCLFEHLKTVPAMAKIIASGAYEFAPLSEGEAAFLLEMMDSDHIVRLTYVATDGKDHVSYLAGPLMNCSGRIQSYQFRKRYALVRLQIAGQEKIVRLGIILNDDIRREMRYGKVEARIDCPREYVIPAGGNRPAGAPSEKLKEGDSVAVVEGAFEGNVAVIRQVKGNAVRITVHIFEREILLEMPSGSVRKLA